MSPVVKPPVPKAKRDALAEHGELAARLLFHRGIADADAARDFLAPDYDAHRHDPFLMADMERAVERVAAALAAGERIAIFSDYDADGVPGGVVLHDFLKRLGYANFENYIPDRHDEGFGLNHGAMEELSERGTKLLITVDCGITDAEEIAKASALGMDVIVTDHHTPPAVLPPAFAILDPKRSDCGYPFKELCGAGVAFKFVEAFLARHGAARDIPVGWEKWLLDLVGLATLSDMVPLVGENRVLARYGLLVLRKTRRPGIAKLLERLRIAREHLTEDDIAFMVTPRINAASRLGKADDAFHLLATSDWASAGALAEKLDKVNDERKGIVAGLVKQLKKLAPERLKGRRVLVAGNPDWRPSLLGLAANTLVEAHGVPVFLWGRDGDGCVKGSCRSPQGVNVVAMMRQAAEEGVLDDYGGHHSTGGFRVAEGKGHLLDEALERAFSVAGVADEEAEGADAELSLDEVSDATYRVVEALAPFGIGNEKPTFLFRGVAPVSVRTFGKENAHLELSFERADGSTVSAIGFFMKPESFATRPVAGVPLNLLASLEQSHFRGRPELRLRIADIL